jgi:hypothetical protein
VAKPVTRKYHDFVNHRHVIYDQVEGQEEFLVTEAV